MLDLVGKILWDKIKVRHKSKSNYADLADFNLEKMKIKSALLLSLL